MGKYTNLARKYAGDSPQEKGGRARLDNISVKMNTTNQETTNPPVSPPAETGTPLRPYAVNAVVRCIHDNAPDACAVCSGYVRWLSAGGDGRVAEAQRDPEAARRAFWRSMKGAG